MCENAGDKVLMISEMYVPWGVEEDKVNHNFNLKIAIKPTQAHTNTENSQQNTKPSNSFCKNFCLSQLITVMAY